MKTKISTEEVHVIRDSDTTFKVKRSKVKVTRPVYSPRRLHTSSCSGQRGNVLSVGNCCCVAVCRLYGAALRRPHGEERGGAYCVSTRTACLTRAADWDSAFTSVCHALQALVLCAVLIHGRQSVEYLKGPCARPPLAGPP